MAVKLTKGGRVSLEKVDGSALKQVCVGLNWGMIEKSGGGLFGFGGGKSKIAVDLDASAGTFSASGQLLETIYYGTRKTNGVIQSANGSIVHSGDDLEGDADGDDGLDNEIITINLERLAADVDQVGIVLNSFQGQDFADIPFATIRVYEGTATRVDNVLAEYDLANDSTFAGQLGMVMGKLYKHNGAWKFAALGEPTGRLQLKETLAHFKQHCL